jgi:hypothetical protein
MLAQPDPHRLGLPLQLTLQARLLPAPATLSSISVTATRVSRPTRSPSTSRAAVVAAALSGDPSMPTRTSTEPLPGMPLATSRDQDRWVLAVTSASNSAIGPNTIPSRPQAKGLWPSRPITIASTNPMHTNVASNSDKNTVNDTCLTYLQVRAAVITARARAWILYAAGRQH